jgi:radical SAM family uncharacterized protein/radical SAM-linked protein
MTENAYLSRVQRPTRYLGREINAVFKDPGDVAFRVALLFPDLYEVGMSHLGLGMLYDILNARPDYWCERAYAPAPDLEAELRRRGEPLGSLESGLPLKDFPLVGVSLQYELSYTNLLAMLDLGGISLLAAHRGPQEAVVVGGGPAAFNPEPVAPFFDALVIGDGEDAILEVAETVQAWRAAGGSRRELWQALEAIEGVYVPAFFEPAWDQDGHLREVLPRGRRRLVKKRLVRDLNRVSLSPRVLVPSCQIVHDRLSVEIVRGCSRGCRYCQAGIIYRPVRERHPEAVRAWVEAALAATGFEEVSLLALSPGDYAALPWLMARLMDHLAAQKVSLSLPSLRADTLAPELMNQIQRVRRTGLTIAPEAGSERLRRAINKNLSEERILAAAQEAFQAGWRLLKLYFMVGLPTETLEDRDSIGSLVQRLLHAAPGGSRPQLNVSLSTFIPKPHTPFQWERQVGLEESRRLLGEVKDRLRQRQVRVKWNSAAQSWLEGVFSRGDRRLAAVLLAAYRQGCRLDAWSEHLRLAPWLEAFREAGVDPEVYLRERSLEETLPWQHLASGVSPSFLVAERARAFEGISTADCRFQGCQDCGACQDPVHDPLHFEAPPMPGPAPRSGQAPQAAPPPFIYRLEYAKVEDARWLSHLELISAVYRALRRAALPVAFSAGFHPLPRVAFHGALPVGVESLCESLDVSLTRPVPPPELISRLNAALPPGVRLLNAYPPAPGRKAPRVAAAVYHVEAPDPQFTPAAAAAFTCREEVWYTRRRPTEVREVNVRPLVASLEVLDDRHLVLEVRLPAKDNLKITEVLAAIFGMPTDRAADLRILKTRVRLEEAQSLFTLNNPPESTLRSGIPPAAGVWLKD